MTDSTWVTPTLVTAWIEDETPGAPVTARPALQDACNAAAAYVEGLAQWAHLWSDADPPVFTPTAEVKLGAIMLAARYLARRGTTLGVAGFTEFGASPILRFDPDIQRLLRIGPSGPFVFGAPTVTEDDVVVTE